jgi:hypothetical protein
MNDSVGFLSFSGAHIIGLEIHVTKLCAALKRFDDVRLETLFRTENNLKIQLEINDCAMVCRITFRHCPAFDCDSNKRQICGNQQ